ncbi:MAG: ATP-binding protein [Planctomycetes bacterium]|nr:ATP-binding protein [Planctomycetota bacterium]
MSERFAVRFPACGRHLRPLREWCRVYLARVLPRRALEELVLAVSEACANTIEHCLGGDACRDVEVEFELRPGSVRARVRNFCLAAVAHRIRPRRPRAIRPRGLGLVFMEECVDRLEYVDQGDGFLSAVLTKRRKGGRRGH